MKRLLSIVGLSFVVLVFSVSPTSGLSLKAQALSTHTFTNPLLTGPADPWIIYANGYYYYMGTDAPAEATDIQIYKSATISGLSTVTPVTVWKPTPGTPDSGDLWAPELHYINNTWYIYYSADASPGDYSSHRLFVLQADTSDPMGSYHEADTGDPSGHGQLLESSGDWAIDPDVFTDSSGKLFITWSGTSSAGQTIYLASMSDPLHLSSNRVQLSIPSRPWELKAGTVNEGPVGFVHDGKTYITYSANDCSTEYYAVGLLTNDSDDGSTYLNASNWSKTGPIFEEHDTVKGPASFVPIHSLDGTEDWFLYHTTPNECDATRTVQAQRLYWDSDGSPLLGYPVDAGVPLQVPSGENGPDGWSSSVTGDGPVGSWTYNSPTSASSTSLGMGQNEVFRGDVSLFDYTVQADVQSVATGTTDPYPKYGIDVAYKDSNNFVQEWIDTKYNVIATQGVVNGVAQGWQNTPLPQGFDPTQYHTLSATKADDTFTFYLDGVEQQQRTFAISNGQIGLVTEDHTANYQNVSVTDNSQGWRNAFGDAAEGDTTDGLKTGNWTINSPSSVESTTLGSGLQQIFRGNPNFENYTVQVDAQWVQTGTTEPYPKYGLYAAYSDHNNYVVAYIDRINNVYATSATVNGVFQGWQNANLPAGFDPTQYHTIKVVKSGSSFTFYLDGTQMQQRTFALLNGQPGLVTDDTVANYQNFAVTNVN